MLEPKTIVCKICGASFEFDQGQVDYYNSKKLDNYPLSCKNCREARRAATRVMYDAVCANPDCKKSFQIPFNPEGKTVYCKDHYTRK